MENNAFQKNKKLQKRFRTIVINIFIWLIIAAFVSSLGMYFGNQHPVDILKIAEINGKVYTYQPGSPFYYLMNTVRENLSKEYKDKTDYESLNHTIVNYSVQLLLNNAILYDFSKKLGITPSQEVLRNILEYSIKGRLTTTPDKGLLEYGEMEYANYSLAGENGDIINVISAYPTSGELYSYFDLYNYNVEAEILYIDITNYIISRITDRDVDQFYQDNISNYASEILVDDITVNNKKLAFEVAKFAGENGWEEASAMYSGQIQKRTSLKLKKESGTVKRFAVAIGTKKGQVVHKPQFENGAYHIMRISGYPSINAMAKLYRNAVVSDYTLKNFAALMEQYNKDIQGAVSKAEGLIREKRDFSAIGNMSGMTYLRTGKLSPVSEFIVDRKGKQSNLPYLQNPEWMDFLFSSGKNQVSKTFSTEGTIIIFKQFNRGTEKNIIYQNIGQDVLVRYMRFKNSAFNQDWSKQLKAHYKTKLFEDDIKKLLSKNAE